MKVKRTERGWAGHFICANRCRFRRNTLLEKGDVRIVVSSVGLMEKWTGDPRQDKNVRGFETIGCERYYETMAFHAEPAPSRYFDADVSREVDFAAPWCIAEIDADDKANAQHDAVVAEIEERIADGEFDNANPIRRSEMRCWKCGNDGTTCDINMQQTGLCYRCQQEQQAETWKPYQVGWECPRCHAIHSPDVKRCFCVPPSEIDTRGISDV